MAYAGKLLWCFSANGTVIVQLAYTISDYNKQNSVTMFGLLSGHQSLSKCSKSSTKCQVKLSIINICH